MAASGGAPWEQPRNPPWDVGPKIVVLGPKPRSKHRLLVRQDKRVEGEPHEPAVSHETPVAEQDRLAQNDGDYGNVHRIAHVAIQTRHPRFCVGAIGAGVPSPCRAKRANESTSPGKPATINSIPTARVG